MDHSKYKQWASKSLPANCESAAHILSDKGVGVFVGGVNWKKGVEGRSCTICGVIAGGTVYLDGVHL